MPKAQGYRYIIHARCSLTSYPEWTMVKMENARSIAKFIFESLLCRWGAIEILVSDNAPQYLQATDYLAKIYHVYRIRISPYNSKAQGPIERWHYDVWEAIIKAADGDISKWPDVAPSVFWAERVTIQKSTGYSPYYLAHGVEPLLPFDLAEATYLAPKLDSLMKTEDLIAQHAIMLQKRPQDHIGTLHCTGWSDLRNGYSVSDDPSSRGPVNPRINLYLARHIQMPQIPDAWNSR